MKTFAEHKVYVMKGNKIHCFMAIQDTIQGIYYCDSSPSDSLNSKAQTESVFKLIHEASKGQNGGSAYFQEAIEAATRNYPFD